MVTKINKKLKDNEPDDVMFKERGLFCKSMREEGWKETTELNWCYELNICFPKKFIY